MSLISRKIAAFAKKVANLSPKPGGTMPVTELQAQFDAAPEELRAALNGAIDDIIADYATKAELSGIQLGQISDGTVTPAKLSFDPATQGELDTHAGVTTAHGAVSAATASRLVIRDANGRAQFATPSAAADAATMGYVDSKFQKGSFTGNGAASRTVNIGVTPKLVILVGAAASGGYKSVTTITPLVGSNGAYSSSVLKIVTNGFVVGVDSNMSNNVNGENYEYFYWG